MPTSTWESMRQDIVRPLGLVTGTTSENIAANTSLVDDDLIDLYPSNDYFNANWYVIVTSNNNDGEYRRVTDYDAAGGTIIVSKAWLPSDSSTSTYELMTVPPNKVMEWYNRARQEVWPHIGIVRDVETVVTGARQFTYEIPSTIRRVNRVYLGERYEAQNDSENLLLNGSFEDWTISTTADNWGVIVGDTTVNQEKQTTSPTNYAVLSGNNSARLIVPGSTAVTLAQTFNSASSSYTAVATEGMEANLSAWVYCNTASRVYLTIDGSNSAVVVNEDSVDIDFRVESNGEANMLFVDGGNDCVSIGTSSDLGGELNVNGIIYGTTNVGLNSGDKVTFTDNTDMRFTVNAGEEMRLEADGDLHVDGDVIAFSTTISDATLKYNINPIEFALDKVKQLKGVTFNYFKDDKASAGLLAQDVEKVMPSAVQEKKLPLHTGDDKLYKTLHYDSMTAILVEAIKELTVKVKKLEER